MHESNQPSMLIKNKFARAILFTVSGLMIGYANFSVKDEAKAWTMMATGAALLMPLLVQDVNQKPG